MDQSSDSQANPKSPPPAKRMSIDETPTVSRSGRTIKPKREFGTETIGHENTPESIVKVAEKIIEEPRKSMGETKIYLRPGGNKLEPER